MITIFSNIISTPPLPLAVRGLGGEAFPTHPQKLSCASVFSKSQLSYGQAALF